MHRILRTAGLVAALTCAATAGPGGAVADQRFEATLAGQAILPAGAMLLMPPPDAPEYFRISGRFTGPELAGTNNPRNERVGSAPATGFFGARPTGFNLPFAGQPVQGFSGIRPIGDGSYWINADNGFGFRANSADAMLMIHRVRPDWPTGQVAVERTIFLSDPNRVLPFPIMTEATTTRYLTGRDLDPESIQLMPDGSFILADEFGPYLIHVDAAGRVLRLIETVLDGEVLRSPDHPGLQIPASPTAELGYRTRRSGGFEPMGMTPDNRTIWAMLEQPILTRSGGQPEGPFLRMLEFDVGRMAWTGRNLRYRLEPGSGGVRELHFIDERRALVIEADNGEGDPGLACAQGQKSTAERPCFVTPARLKRIYLIDLGSVDAEGYVRKIGHIDLMTIRDPGRVARQRGDRPAGASDDVFTFPFFTAEGVAMVDADHIVVVVDNNLPFSAGRHVYRADDNEFVLLRVPEFLRAR